VDRQHEAAEADSGNFEEIASFHWNVSTIGQAGTGIAGAGRSQAGNARARSGSVGSAQSGPMVFQQARDVM
jgi:hypothetical protein